jgi:hypothetical protein
VAVISCVSRDIEEVRTPLNDLQEAHPVGKLPRHAVCHCQFRISMRNWPVTLSLAFVGDLTSISNLSALPSIRAVAKVDATMLGGSTSIGAVPRTRKHREKQQKMEIPKEFFTLQSMLTLTGATGAVYVVCNSMQAAFNFNPKWLALLLAQIVSALGVALSGGHGLDYFVGVVNGCLIFTSAAGVVAVSSGSNARARGDTAVTADDLRRGISTRSPHRRHFPSPWF